jgi:3-oxoacyl-[acyl-carrier-protein] synthase II
VSSIAIIASGAISGLGEGTAATTAGEVGHPARVAIGGDEELARAGLARPFAARAWPVGDEGRAAALLERALVACASDLDRVRSGWRDERVGLVLGTSSGGMRAAERAFADLAGGRPIPDRVAPTYAGPLERGIRALRTPLDPCILVLGACASAALSVGLGVRWLERGACDLVIAGGFDEVTVFVAAGFEALRATTASPPPRPFRAGRDGMSLGEGAAVVALVRAGGKGARAFVTGFGATSDAVHLTAPDRAGAGLARAAKAALAEAGPGRVDLVSAHGTATPFNDAAEARAIASVLGDDLEHAVVHPFKAQVGHTLGAAGAIELLASVDALARGLLPAAAGDGPLDEDARVRLLTRCMAGRPGRALKLASAFGGANAALVVSGVPGVTPGARRAAFIHGAAHVAGEDALEDLAARTGLAVDRLGRADSLVRMALAALASLKAQVGSLSGAGVVIGTALGPIETNALFAARIRERGARAAEPRRFPYTSPNAVAGECSIAFGLSGPSFAVGGGMHAALEALAVGAVLVEAGDAERVAVVAVDDAGPITRALTDGTLASGAVAVLLTAQEGAGARARIGELSVRRGAAHREVVAAGHAALMPLLAGALPRELVAASPPDVIARVTLEDRV